MKTKKFQKKLGLHKNTVANLSSNEQAGVNGGEIKTVYTNCIICTHTQDASCLTVCADCPTMCGSAQACSC